MFEIINYEIIRQVRQKYLSFPDIIQSKYSKKRFFLTYRSGDGHHPSYSKLHFLVSETNCRTWKEIRRFNLNFNLNGKVWNCPRFSYFPDGSLNILCDTKTNLDERKAFFEVNILKSYDEGNNFHLKKTGIYGMLPDHVISFKNNLYCANHLYDKKYSNLIQLINYSKDQGITWYDRSILAREDNNAFCEASLINYKNLYLLAYLRDNIKGARPIYKYISFNGHQWKKWGKLPVCGHRPTAILEDDRIFIAFRNTEKITLSVLTALLNKQGREKKIEVIDIDDEKKENKYHFGYTGITKCGNDTYCVVYYIQKEKKNPYIKSCFLKFKK